MTTSPEEYPTWFFENFINVDDFCDLKDIQYKYFIYNNDISTDFDVSFAENH